MTWQQRPGHSDAYLLPNLLKKTAILQAQQAHESLRPRTRRCRGRPADAKSAASGNSTTARMRTLTTTYSPCSRIVHLGSSHRSRSQMIRNDCIRGARLIKSTKPIFSGWSNRRARKGRAMHEAYRSRWNRSRKGKRTSCYSHRPRTDQYHSMGACHSKRTNTSAYRTSNKSNRSSRETRLPRSRTRVPISAVASSSAGEPQLTARCSSAPSSASSSTSGSKSKKRRTQPWSATCRRF